MESFPFVFTVFFSLLGPVKLLPAFAGATKGRGERFQRATAVRAVLIASAIVAFLALAGGALLAKYRISLDGVRIAGGLVLLLAALDVIFSKPQPQPQPGDPTVTPLHLAVSPLASPIIVPPAGVAAVLIFVKLSAERPGVMQAVGIALAIIMTLNFLVMYFNSRILKRSGVLMILRLLGAVLVFLQVCLALDTILISLDHLGAIRYVAGPGL